MRGAGLLIFTLAAAVPAWAAPEEGRPASRPAAAVAGVTVKDAVLRLPLGGKGTGALYLTLENGSGAELAVVGAKTPAAGHVMLHETKTEGDVAKMVHVSRWVVPAGGELVLAPRGKHIMVMGLSGLSPGDRVPFELQLEGGGRVKLEAKAVGLDGG